MENVTLIGASLSIVLNTLAARSFEPTWKELTFKNKAVVVFIWMLTMKLFWYIPYKILTSRNTLAIIQLVASLVLIYLGLKFLI